MLFDFDLRCVALTLLIRTGNGKPGLARVASLAIAPIDLLDTADSGTLVDKNKSDAEGIAKVHTRHGSQAVDKVSTLPDRGGILAVDCINEAVLWREQTRRHTRIEDEDGEGEQVQQGHGATHGREAGKGRRHVVVECDETRPNG